MSIEENISSIAGYVEDAFVPTRLYVATQMAAALIAHMEHATKYDIARRAVEVADAVIDEALQ